MKKLNQLHDSEKVEVVLRKTMDYSSYKQMFDSIIKKGWHIQAYKIGFYKKGLSEEINS